MVFFQQFGFSVLQFIIYFTPFRVFRSYFDNFCLLFVSFLNLKFKFLLLQSFIVLQIQSKGFSLLKALRSTLINLGSEITLGRTLVTFPETSHLEKRTLKLNGLHAAGLRFQNLSRDTLRMSIVLYPAVCSTTKFRTNSFCGT